MFSEESVVRDVAQDIDIDLEAALNPAEAEGTFRDTRECAALALIGGQGALLLSPPTPRPTKKG
ncbi:hypothetical protein K7472_01465 [Streptomyces sp. PTM05]|uniref:Uncharacterized protein n=1 Tax=Streptantibioticus parmotrematis TaxID=2873249 RepID=A0ABS7QNY0_9ACTN|nr:hypothetical protein [Streptantibioticus parmotrematis]MBY8883514.1 hypothetical protein [Streptantibioticus parmotrematis]